MKLRSRFLGPRACVILAGVVQCLPLNFAAEPSNLTWQVLHSGGGGQLADVVECGGTIVAGGPDGLLITRDGGTWESRQLEESGFWEGGPYTVSIAVDGLGHVGERFIAVGRAIVPSGMWGLQAVFLASSSDGSDWIVERGHTACDRGWARMQLVSFEGGLAAIGHAECGMNSYPIGKMTSNGIDWVNSSFECPAGRLCAPVNAATGYRGRIYAAGGVADWSMPPNSRAVVYVSEDGANWTHAYDQQGWPLKVIACGDESIVAAGELCFAVHSSDGVDWIRSDFNPGAAVPANAAAIVYANGRFLLLAKNDLSAEPESYLSTDGGTTWAPIPNPPVTGAIAAGGGLFVAVGNHGAVYASRNGIDWTPSNTGVTNDLTGVRFIDPRFYVLGTDGLVLRSSAQQTDCTLGYTFDPPDSLCLTFKSGTLQSAATASGPWIDVTESSPYCVKTVFPMTFFRVKYP